MRQAAQLALHVVKGFAHELRVSLHRRGLPYPSLKTSGTARFETDVSWPQPSPISPHMPAAVLHIPADELREFLAKIVTRFQRQVTFSWLSGIRYLHRKPHLDCPDDATFTRHMTDTVYVYFLTDDLDAADRALLARNGISTEGVRKSDLAPVSTIETLEGLYCTGSVCYFRESTRARVKSFDVLGIAMVDRQFDLGELITPADGNAWKHAKMHALQGATYLSLFVTHPRCHFPMDAIIAITKTFLPKGHKVYKVLEPHMYLQVPLDYSVLHVKNGPGFNDPRLYYTAFSGAGRSQYRLFEYSHAGVPGRAAFPPYTFGYLFHARNTDYLAFLLGYHAIIRQFVSTVVADVEVDDVLQEWMRHCAQWSRGFGGPRAALDKEWLVDCIATVIWNCSVVHSSDHWDFHAIPMEHKPTRLRVPPPFTRRDVGFEPSALTEPGDRMRHYMWHELYMRQWTVKLLCDVDYQFDEPSLKEANRDFLTQLGSYAARQSHKYAPLDQIAVSIHF